MSRSAGIDLSTSPARTVLAIVDWTGPAPRLVELQAGHVEALPEADVVGIDAPLGWPDGFGEQLVRWAREGAWADDERHALRVSDVHVRDATGKTPMSVAANLIGATAMHAARMLTAWGARRDGAGAWLAGDTRVCEVYPAASVLRWFEDGRTLLAGYKQRTGTAERERLLERVVGATGLQLSPAEHARLVSTDDHLDALLAACAARTAALGLVDAPPADRLAVVDREGWIQLPRAGSLGPALLQC